jgi:hypothetical protein
MNMLTNKSQITKWSSRGRRCVWRGAGIAGCKWGYWTAVGRSYRLFCYYTQTENIKRFEQRAVGGFTVRMTSGWVVAVLHSKQDLAYVHLSRSL